MLNLLSALAHRTAKCSTRPRFVGRRGWQRDPERSRLREVVTSNELFLGLRCFFRPELDFCADPELDRGLALVAENPDVVRRRLACDLSIVGVSGALFARLRCGNRRRVLLSCFGGAARVRRWSRVARWWLAATFTFLSCLALLDFPPAAAPRTAPCRLRRMTSFFCSVGLLGSTWFRRHGRGCAAASGPGRRVLFSGWTLWISSSPSSWYASRRQRGSPVWTGLGRSVWFRSWFGRSRCVYVDLAQGSLSPSRRACAS